MKTSETPKERFKRLATKRTNEILKRLKTLGNRANKQFYEYAEAEIETIFSAIEKKVKETKAKFHFEREEKFKL